MTPYLLDETLGIICFNLLTLERGNGPREIKGHVPWVSQSQELLCNRMAMCTRVRVEAPFYRGGREALSAGPRSITGRAGSNSRCVSYPAGCYRHLHLGRQSSTHLPAPREYLSAARRLLAGGDRALSGTSRAAQTSARLGLANPGPFTSERRGPRLVSPDAEENWKALAPARRQGHLVSFPRALILPPQQSIDPVLASGHHRATDN